MLVLSRKVGQQILIGPDIVIEVTQIAGKVVRLGINAPADVGIIRRGGNWEPENVHRQNPTDRPRQC